MRLVAALAALLGLEVNVLVERLRRDAALYGVIGGFALIGFIFLLVALNAALSQLWGPIYGPLALGGGALVVALLVWGVASVSRGRRVAHARERKRASETSAAVTTAAIAALPLIASSPVVRKWGLPIAGAAAAAWLLLREAGKGDPPPQG